MQVFPKNIPLQTAIINFSTAADQTIVTGVTGKSIYVVKMVASAAGVTSITVKSGATALSGPIPLNTAEEFRLWEGDTYWWVTNPGDNLIFNNSAAVAVGGTLWYVQQ